jgi:hypothetical protein
MSLVLPLIGMGISAFGTAMQARQNAKANELAESNYDKARGLILTERSANPIDSITNKALLSKFDRRMRRTDEAIQNMAAAGGATIENTLAAKQASNEAMADMYSGILQGETARRDAFTQQLLNLDMQRTGQQMAAKQASGQAWSSLANGIAGGLTTLGGALQEEKLFNKYLQTIG